MYHIVFDDFKGNLKAVHLTSSRLMSAAKHGAVLVTTLLVLSGCDKAAPVETETQRPTPELPALPVLELDGLPDVVRAQIGQLQEQVIDAPTDGRANAQFAKLLHAYTLLAPANVMYERCQLLRPSDLDCIYLQSLVAKDLGNHELAIERLSTLIKRKANFPRAKVALADSYRILSQLDQAQALYEEALTLNPKSLETQYGLAQTLVAAGRFDEALGYLEAMHASGQQFGAVHSLLAVIARRHKNSSDVVFHTAAAKRFAEDKIPYQDRKLWAVQDLQQSDARYTREARALFLAGRLREALPLYLKAIELNSDNAGVHAVLVGIYGQLGQMTNAESHFQKAIKLNPKDVLPYLNYATVSMKRGEFKQAQEYFARILELQPHHAEARTMHAYCYQLLGQDEDNIGQYQQALSDDPTFQLAHYLVGRHVRDTSSCTAAVEHFEKSIRIEETATPVFKADLAGCYLDLNRLEEAKSMVDSGLQLAEKYNNASAKKALYAVDQRWQALSAESD